MKVEEQLLPDTKLAPTYDKLVWLYVYRSFKEDEADRSAERISLRFGVTSWPQLFLVDPNTLEVLAHTGRTAESFLAAVNGAKVDKARYAGTHDKLVDAEARAVALELRPSKKAARKGLEDEDIVVRVRALRILAKEDPEVVVERAEALLAVPNDPFRYAVCEVLAKAASPKAAKALEALVEKPKDSLNPNVLRIRAVEALATCGDGASVDAIGPHAASGDYRNGLTGVSIDALGEIAKRHKKARKKVLKVLREAYPRPPAAKGEGAPDERELRMCVALAQRVHAALDAKMPFPKVYDEEARQKLMKAAR